MKTTLRIACIVALTLATPIKTTIMTPDAPEGQPKLKNSHDFISEVQGNNQNIYIIVFSKDDNKYLDDIKKALDAAPQNEELKQYDIF